MRTHTSIEVIEMLLTTKRQCIATENIIVTEGFLIRLQSELKQLEKIALKMIAINRGGRWIDVMAEEVELRAMLAKWDKYE